MKKLILIAFAFLLSLTVFYSCNEPVIEESNEDALELKSANTGAKSYIVVLNDADLNIELSKLKGYEKKQEVMKAVSARILNRAGVTDGEVEHVYGTAIKGFSVKIAPGQLKKLEEDPSVKYVEEDQVITLGNPKIEGTVTAMAQTLPWGIQRVNGGANGEGKTAWIIDTGVDLTHPDLTVDVARSAWFVSRVTSANDDNGHGTHVAGTIAALDNGIGVIGVAAGAKVVPVKVLDRRGSGTTTGVIAGIDYVAENGAAGDVANMSLGGGVSTSLDAAVLAASTNVIFALAAGNESDNANNHSPARVNGPNIYTISAFGEGDIWASFSNYGNPPVEWCEPGVSILSCYKGGGYATLSGTSMATPHAAGLLLLGKTNLISGGNVIGDPDGNPDPIMVYSGSVTPPSNISPTANFTFTTNNLDVTFTDESSDSDGTISTRSWNFGDGGTSTATNPSHNYAAAGSYLVTLTVTDNQGATGTVTKEVTVTSPSGGEIILTAVITGSKVKKATLNCSGAVGASVEIYKDGNLLTTTANTGSYSENLGKITTGTFTYQIKDETGTFSNPATATVN